MTKSTFSIIALHVFALDGGVGEFVEAGTAFEQQDRHAEFHRELCLQFVLGTMMDQRVRHVGIGADADMLHVFGADAVLLDQPQHFRHAGMRQRARRMRLDGNAGIGEGPRRAELAEDGILVVAAARSGEETARRLEDARRGCPAVGGKLGGSDAAFRRTPGMEGFRHRAEVFTQAGGLAAGDRQRPQRGVHVETHQPSAGGGRSERPAGGGRMEAGLVVARRDRLGDLALDFNAQMIGQHEILARGFEQFRHRECRRQGRSRRMRQQTIDAVLGDGELRVVVIVGVDADTVGECSKARRNLAAAADDGRSAVGKTEIVEMATDQFAALGNRTGKSQTEAVKYRFLAEFHDFCRKCPRTVVSTTNSATYFVSATSTALFWSIPNPPVAMSSE